MRHDEFKENLNSYDAMSSMLKTHSYEKLLDAAAKLAGVFPKNMERYPMCGHSNGMNSYTYRFTLLDLLKNVQHYDWLYGRLEDDASRLVFSSLIAYRLFPAQRFLKAAYDGKHPQYFDKDVVSCGENEDRGLRDPAKGKAASPP